MTIEKTRAEVIASVWQAVAQSGVDLSAVPKEDQEKLVSKIADTLLLTVDNILENAQLEDQPEAPPEALEPLEVVTDDAAEKILWEGRPFLSLVEKYFVTSERIKIVRGMVARDVENYELIRIQDIDLKQNVSERLLKIGDITIRGADASKSEVTLRNVREPEHVYETLRRAWLEARKRYGLQFREFM